MFESEKCSGAATPGTTKTKVDQKEYDAWKGMNQKGN